MRPHRSTRKAWRSPAAFFLTTALCWTAGARTAAAAIKVACVGEHSTHGHAFPGLNRELQMPPNQEYPAQLQGLLGPAYEVRNFGDCCATVMQGYTPAETHPYINGSLNAGEGPGYKESIAFLPDIVVIGSWGRHDWGLAKAPGQVFTPAAFQSGYEDLIKRYQALSSKPKIIISYPIPILFGQGDVPDQGVTTSSVKPLIDAVAQKYNLPIVDLYTPFLNHRELFKQPPDGEGEGEHTTIAGMTVIAKAVAAVMMQQAALGDGGGVDGSFMAMDASLGVGGAGGAGGSAGSGGAGGSAGAGTAGQGTSGQAGSSTMAQTGGSNAAGSSDSPAPAAEDSGCACSLANDRSSAGRAAALGVGALALAVRRRRREKVQL